MFNIFVFAATILIKWVWLKTQYFAPKWRNKIMCVINLFHICIKLLDQILISKKTCPWILKRLSKTFGMQFEWRMKVENVKDIPFFNLMNMLKSYLHCSRNKKESYFDPLFFACLSVWLYIGVQGDSFVCW